MWTVKYNCVQWYWSKKNEGGGGEGIYSLHYRVQSQKQRFLFSFDELVGKGLDNNLEKIWLKSWSKQLIVILLSLCQCVYCVL